MAEELPHVGHCRGSFSFVVGVTVDLSRGASSDESEQPLLSKRTVTKWGKGVGWMGYLGFLMQVGGWVVLQSQTRRIGAMNPRSEALRRKVFQRPGPGFSALREVRRAVLPIALEIA